MATLDPQSRAPFLTLHTQNTGKGDDIRACRGRGRVRVPRLDPHTHDISTVTRKQASA